MRALACLPLLAGCSQLLGLDDLHQNAAATDAPIVPPDDVARGLIRARNACVRSRGDGSDDHASGL